jgi:hypothetical protein
MCWNPTHALAREVGATMTVDPTKAKVIEMPPHRSRPACGVSRIVAA